MQVDQIHYAENTSGHWNHQVINDIGVAPFVVAEPAGTVHISCVIRHSNHNYIVLARNRWAGDTIWTADTLDTEPAPYSISQMRGAHDGTLHALFLGRDCYYCTDPNRLFYSKRALGADAWEPWQHIDTRSAGGQLALDCENNVHILHSYFDYEDIHFYRYYSTNESGEWVQSNFSFGIPAYLVGGPTSFLIDSYDRGHALFPAHNEQNYETTDLLYYASPMAFFDGLNYAELIDYVYLDAITPCGFQRYDQNCDARVDALDVTWLIAYLYAGGPWGCR